MDLMDREFESLAVFNRALDAAFGIGVGEVRTRELRERGRVSKTNSTDAWDAHASDSYLLETAAGLMSDHDLDNEARELAQLVADQDVTSEKDFRDALSAWLSWDRELLDQAVAEVNARRK